MRFIGFIGPSYKLNSVNVDCQRCINLYPELDEIGTGKEKEVAALVPTPGLGLLANIGAGPIRCSYRATNGILYIVSKDKLYSVNSAWSSTLLGSLSTTSGQVSISDNGLQLILVDGPYGYFYDFTTLAYNQITDPAFPGATQVTFQDGYFIFIKPNSGQFFISGLNAVTFDALDIASSEGSPDNIVATVSDHRDLWMFNEQTVEVFYDSGAALFPFERVQGAYIEVGCAAAFSVAKMNNTVIWLGKDERGTGIVYMAAGYQPTRISTHAVEQAIQKYGDISDAVAYTYQENGHYFYVLNFTNANTSWVFDSSTKLWHERIYYNQGAPERHRANSHAFAYSTHVVGDYQNGNLYQLSTDFKDDNGNALIRKRAAPHITDGLTRLSHHSFQLDIETGTGLDGIGQGTDPQAMLRWSDDGGHTWSNEKWVSIGKIGQTKARAIWRRLGMSRDRVYEVSVSDPVKVTFIGAELNIEKARD